MEQKYEVYVYANGESVYITKKMTFTQFDSNTGKILFKCFDDSDTPMTDIEYAALNVERPDGEKYTFGMTHNGFNVFEINGNEVLLILPIPALYVAGTVKFSVAFHRQGMQRLTVIDYTYNVRADKTGDIPDDEANKVPLLNDLIDRTQAAKSTVEDAAARASAAAAQAEEIAEADYVTESIYTDEEVILDVESVNGIKGQIAAETNSIIAYGGNADGVTANDLVFIAAKVKGRVHFPQNNTNNAVYYFSSVPDFSNCEITCTAGVKLSLPTTNGVTFKNSKISSAISIISRDRNNTGLLEKNTYDRGLYVSGNMNNVFEVENAKVVDTSIFELLQLHITSTAKYQTPGALVLNNGMYSYDTSKITDYDYTFLGGIDFTPGIGKAYSCTFKVDDIESLNLTDTDKGNIRFCVGVIPKDSNGNSDYNRFRLFSVKMTGDMYSGENLGGAPYWVEDKVDTAASNAYKLAKNNSSVMVYARAINSKNTEIYVNGMYVTTIKNTTYDTAKIFFGHIQYTAAQLGKSHIGDIIECDIKKGNIGKALNIAVFSDSIGYGEGCSIGWSEHLKNILAGRRGINKVNVQNYAASGETADQQLYRLKNADLTGVNVAACVVGTNDVQLGTDIVTFRQTIQTIIDFAKSKAGRVILGIPAMWISSQEAGYGFQNLNSYAGGAYRSAILYVAAQNNVKVVDLMSNFGEIEPSTEILRDTLHPQTWGEVVIANAFANAIIKELCVDIA